MNNNNYQKIDILYVFRVFLSYWPIILLSVCLFASMGYLYLRFSSKTYKVYSRIYISTNRSHNSSGGNQYVNVNEMMNEEKSFTNEITFLKSSPLIKEVINDMNLFTSYYIKEDKIPKEVPFSFYNIYKASPFIVVVDEESQQPINTLFYIKIIDEEHFSIHSAEPNVLLYNIKDDVLSKYPIYFFLSGNFKFGDVISNDYCSFKILLNSNYNADQYLGKDLFFKFNSPTIMAYTFQEALSVRTAFYESNIADLTFEYENLDLAKDFLTRLIDKYIQNNLYKKNFNANNTIEYIDRQLNTVSGSLGQSEKQLQDFRTSKDFMNINEKSTTIYGQRQNLEQNRDEITDRYQNLQRLKQYFDDNKDSATFIAPSFMGFSDVTLATLIQELTTLSSERQNLINTNQLRNPRLKTLETNIGTIKKVISDNITFNLNTASNELKDINQRIIEIDREIANLPKTQRQLIGLEREFNINDAVYTSLLDKRIQAQIIKSSNVPDIEIIEPVRYLEISSPSTTKTGVIALFLGGFFPSIYIIIVNFLTTKIRSKEELVRFSSLTNVGTIPHNNKSQINVIVNYPQSLIAERFHAIRSNLVYFMMGENHKCVLITSTLQNEGKSFVSLNIASSFASSGYKSLLVSFDLRMSNRLLSELRTDSESGLSQYLINQSTLKDIINTTKIPNLDYIYNGTIPPDPVALLSSPRIKEFFSEVKSKYDYIIIDTPPFGLVTDAFLLMHYADISLYVSRLGVITKKALKQSMEDLGSKNIEKVYLVQNDITKVEKAYSQNYAYEEPSKGFFQKLFKRKEK